MSTLIFPPSLMNGEADQAQLNWPASGRVFQKNGHSDRRVSLRRSTDQGMGHSAKIWQAPKASVDKLGNGPAHPDAGNPHVRFDERGMGNGATPHGPSYRALLDSTEPEVPMRAANVG